VQGARRAGGQEGQRDFTNGDMNMIGYARGWVSGSICIGKIMGYRRGGEEGVERASRGADMSGEKKESGRHRTIEWDAEGEG
jgi:hypothetical protein